MAYILLYVDDIILIAFSDKLRQSIISLLSSEFAMNDLGPLSYFLGIAVTRHTGGLFLCLKRNMLLRSLIMSACHRVSHLLF